MSFGRVQGVYSWAMSNWGEVDAWCCVRGIDPLDLPAYRFYNLMVYMLKENLDEDQRLALEQNLEAMDTARHPFQQIEIFKKPKLRAVPDPVDPDAPPKKNPRPRRVPDWYMGDGPAAKRALTMMTTLPR